MATLAAEWISNGGKIKKKQLDPSYFQRQGPPPRGRGVWVESLSSQLDPFWRCEKEEMRTRCKDTDAPAQRLGSPDAWLDIRTRKKATCHLLAAHSVPRTVRCISFPNPLRLVPLSPFYVRGKLGLREEK